MRSLWSLSLFLSRGGWKGTTTTNQLHPVLLLLLLLSSSSTSSPCFPLVSRTISMISARGRTPDISLRVCTLASFLYERDLFVPYREEEEKGRKNCPRFLSISWKTTVPAEVRTRSNENEWKWIQKKSEKRRLRARKKTNIRRLLLCTRRDDTRCIRHARLRYATSPRWDFPDEPFPACIDNNNSTLVRFDAFTHAHTLLRY